MPTIAQAVIESVFDASLKSFLTQELQEILEGVNERSNCARWAMYLEMAARDRGLTDYIADAEYNRKQDGKIKTILDEHYVVVTINCDLVLHSRGANIAEDNLIAIEVKKSERPEGEKESDRKRLRALTKESFDDTWNNDGTMPPEHVCGYRLGVFVELDRVRRLCIVERYRSGEFFDRSVAAF